MHRIESLSSWVVVLEGFGEVSPGVTQLYSAYLRANEANERVNIPF